MLDAGTRAYAFARACGIIGKSFVGKRIASLAGLHTLSEFEHIVFPNEIKEMPSRELLRDLESRVVDRAVNQIITIVDAYEKPPELLLWLLQAYELSDLKTCMHYIDAKKKEPPALCNLGKYRTVNFDAWPDMGAMLKGTDLEHILPNDAEIDFSQAEIQIDNIYYSRVKDVLFKLNGSDREIAHKILEQEISIRNCVWVLRMRSYFEKKPEDIEKYLINIKMRQSQTGKTVSLSKEAVQSLNFHLDTRSDWKGWKWEKFLNGEQYGHWRADPKHFQNTASKYLYHLALRNFRLEPMSVSMAFCYIKIKQYEEDLLTSIVEGLGLGLSSTDVLELLEAA
jgi:vacuolar-type H+-ATPase subunit C/Vma6